jgi:periplasmic divalent cation tolerance protein
MKVCISTCSTADADRLAEALVSERLAACVNLVGPIRSRYWWEGAVQDDEEMLLVIKTRDDLVPALMDRLKALHPYDVPEFLAMPVETVLPAYLAWVERETLARSAQSG